MKYNQSIVAIFLFATSLPSTNAFVPSAKRGFSPVSSRRSTVVDETSQIGTESKLDSLTSDLISKLRFREVQRELERRALDASGTLSAMKNRLRAATVGVKGPMTTEGSSQSRIIDADAINEVCKIYRVLPSKCVVGSPN